MPTNPGNQNHPLKTALRMKNSIPVDAAGGVVFRIFDGELQVLLIFRNGRWDLPKGKVESGESIEMAAVREVAEETGSRLPSIISPLGATFHSYAQAGKEYDKTTYWFTMIITVNEDLEPQAEEGIEAVKWVELQNAIQMLGYDNLKEVCRRFEKSLAHFLTITGKKKALT